MDYNQVKELIGIIDQSSMESFRLTMDNVSMEMHKTATIMTDSGSKLLSYEGNDVVLNELVQTVTDQGSTSVPIGTKPQTTPKSEDFTGTVVKSPIVGTYYASATPGSKPFISVGDVVKAGDVLCIIEAMKVMNEITAKEGGTIVEILVENESIVEYNQPLVKIQ